MVNNINYHINRFTSFYFQKWSFSTSFTPVTKWEYKVGNSLFEHLKTCPCNQESSKNIKTKPFCPAPELISLQKLPSDHKNKVKNKADDD